MIFIVYLTKTSYLCHINNKNCTMKKILTLAFAALTLLATACGKSNDENPKPQDDAKKALIGTWRIEKIVINNIEMDRTECEKKSYFVFTENTFSVYNFSDRKCDNPEKTEGTYSISNDILILVSKEKTLDTTFSILENKLIMNRTGKNEFGESRTIKQILIKQ